MKKEIIIYRILNSLPFIFIAGFVGFLVTALITRENSFQYFIWFELTGIFLILSIFSVIVYINLAKSDWYKKASQEIRNEKYNKIKLQKNIKDYIININFENTYEEIGRLLSEYTYAGLEKGTVFYCKKKSIYNVKKNSFDLFYILKDEYENTFDIDKEKGKIEEYAEDIKEFLESKFKESDFINCVILFRHNKINDLERAFYYNFVGLWESEMLNGTFIKNQYFNYCGISKEDKKAFFYLKLNSDEGDEADLSHIIINELKLEHLSLIK